MYNNGKIYVKKWPKWKLNWLFGFMCLIGNILLVSSTHVTGTFSPQHFFKFIIKFGFPKADTQTQHHEPFGYIYGNVSAKHATATAISTMTLAVLDKTSFIHLYNNRTFQYYNRERACQHMFEPLNELVYDVNCNNKAKLDYFRQVPCPNNQLCIDENLPNNVIAGHQFTYVISKARNPRYWYVVLIACYRNHTTCKWHATETHNKLTTTINDASLYYDIHIVNTNPNNSATYPLTFQFSFDQQNLLEMYLLFIFIYIILVPMQIYAVRLQKHPVTKLFTLSLCCEFISLFLIAIHYAKFASNGIGFNNLQTAGDILDIFSRATFMLILLLMAKGWAVTRQQISRLGWITLLSIWIFYCAFYVFLYIWDQTEIDITCDQDEYQSWPGWIILLLRTTFMMWFLYELRNTMKYEHSSKKLNFLLHLGASSLVWFIYLPIVAIVALQVNPMWRRKLLLGITNSADCLAYCIMTGLLWPNRAGQYLLLAGTKYNGMDELDEFNEAPHIVREREQCLNTAPDDVKFLGLDKKVSTASDESNCKLDIGDEHNVVLFDAEDLDVKLFTAPN